MLSCRLTAVYFLISTIVLSLTELFLLKINVKVSEVVSRELFKEGQLEPIGFSSVIEKVR